MTRRRARGHAHGDAIKAPTVAASNRFGDKQRQGVHRAISVVRRCAGPGALMAARLDEEDRLG